MLKYEDFHKILNIGILLSTQKDRNRLLSTIVESGLEITNCDAGTLYLYEEDSLVFKIMKTLSMGINRGAHGEAIDLPPVPMKEENVCAYTAIHREVVNVPDVMSDKRYDFSGPIQYESLTGYRTSSMLVIPLENSKNELVGVLQLLNAMDEEGNIIPFDEQYGVIIRSLGAMASMELTNLSYTEELKAQLYSFVEAFTTALDERTPYNASHTRNVAKDAGLLADYINRQHEKGLCQESFSPDRKEMLVLAALLHDIGKITVPLEIMNRPTRLHHDIAVVEERFELLKCLYEVDLLKGVISEEEYRQTVEELSSDLEFIHKINSIDYLDDEAYARICALSKKQHVKQDGTVTPYLMEREAYYLSVRKGTLTPEDRKEMENHVVLTEKILSKVRFNKDYAIVPKWAGSHHEYLDGSGYPNHLKAEDLDLETRILAVADIYDALTADRPYKGPLPRGKAIEILKSMAEEGKVELRLVEWLDKALEEAEG